MLKMTTQLIYDELNARGLKVEVLDEKKNILRFWDNSGKTHFLKSDQSSKTSLINYVIAKDKNIVNLLAAELDISLPKTIKYTDLAGANKFLFEEHCVVVKPQDSAHGKGVTTNITTQEQLEDALAFARTESKNILIQTHVVGDDYRLLYIDSKLAAATIREPASVVGDGVSQIEQLILKENTNPERGIKYSKKINIIDIEAAKRYLGSNMHSIPEEGEKVQVVGTANMGTGGLAIDVTDNVQTKMIQQATKIVEYLGMALCGVDFVYDIDHDKPFLIEVNASPSFGLHEYPSVGQPRQVTKLFVDWITEASHIDKNSNSN